MRNIDEMSRNQIVYWIGYMKNGGRGTEAKLSLCYDLEKWMMVTLASIAVSLTVGLIGLAYGQESNQVVYGQNSSSRVDQLIEDTKRNNAIEESYKSELIKRMENTTCLPQTIISKGKSYPYNHYSFSISELELILKDCVERGIIK